MDNIVRGIGMVALSISSTYGIVCFARNLARKYLIARGLKAEMNVTVRHMKDGIMVGGEGVGSPTAPQLIALTNYLENHILPQMFDRMNKAGISKQMYERVAKEARQGGN